jgi:methionyl-tRNA formyltransferase
MRVVAIVNGYTGALCLQELVDQGDEVVGVVTGPGVPSPHTPPEASVKLTADLNLLPVYQPPYERINTPEFVTLLRKLHPDLIVSMHYPVIFKRPILEIPPLGCINEHPSRVPAGRGMTPSSWHMLIGDTHNWITLHYLNEGIDTGDVIMQGCVEITPEDTGVTTSRKLSREGHRVFREALPLIREGRAPRTPQNEIEGVEPSYYSWKPWYAQIQWDWSAEKIALHVRTLTHPKDRGSWTGEGYTFLGGREVRVWEAKPAEERAGTEGPLPGQILAVIGQGLLVKAGEGAVVVTDADIQGSEAAGLDGLFGVLATGLPAFFERPVVRQGGQVP